VCFSPDGRRALATAGGNRLYLWDLELEDLLQAFPEDGPADRPLTRAVFSPDGRFIACGTCRGFVYLWPLGD
jgi:WD40 repeat protein